MKLPLLLALAVPLLAANPSTVRDSATRAVSLIQKVAGQWRSPCLSCHHQTMPMLALQSARTHGIPVDEAAAKLAAERTFKVFADFDSIVQVRELIDPAMSEGYALVGAHAAGVAPNDSTAAFTRHVARIQRADGSWPSFDARPPHSDGLFVATAVAARVTALYLPVRAAAEKKRRLAAAANWLATAKPESTEDLTYRLLGLHWTGGGSTKDAAKTLIVAQRSDGGWGQLSAIADSDAYSTGQALYALRVAGGIAATDAVFQRGLDWLIRNQAQDGSWHVKSRIQTPVPISPPYFESGFPYGHDQWLSCAATSWAVMALAEALPATSAKPLALGGVAPPSTPWIETAMFGSADEMRAIDPNAATAGGTTALMLAADDAAKVRVLLQRGANAKAVTKSGFDALMMASLFPANRPALEALVAVGLDAKPRQGVKYRAHALTHAIFTGDASMVTYLIEHGGDPNAPHALLGTAPMSPLSIAANMDYGNVVQVLQQKGAKMDVRDDNGLTDLSYAALGHKNDAVRALLAAGANPKVKDKFGLTPLEHTNGILYMSPKTAELLKAAAK